MIIRKLRLQRAWSQEQLAEVSGLSIRTIQRVERGEPAGLESLKYVAAALRVNVKDLTGEPTMLDTSLNDAEHQALKDVRDIKAFYHHLIQYLLTMLLLAGINWWFTPGTLWVIWPALGWGIGIVWHGLSVFEVITLFSPEWEQRQVKKRLARYSDRNS